MKFIFLIMSFASMLFSAQQRQIVLGSFSIESNALFYSLSVQKTIDTDENLKSLLEKYNVKVEYKKIGAYNVVAICPFDDYPSLFQTIAAVKKHYPQAYAIRFPAFSTMIEKKQVEEKVIEEEPVIKKPEPMQISDEEPDIAELETEVKALEDEPEAQKSELVEPEFVPAASPVVKKPTPLPAPVQMMDEADNFNEIMLLLLLLLVIIAYIIYKIKAKKKELPPEE